MRKPKSDYVIQTVANALLLLEGFAEEEELGVTELSRRLKLHKNNVFRLLATLEERGYIEQSPHSDRYRLGVQCLALGRAFLGSRNLQRQARPILEALVRETGEVAHLAVLRDFEVVHLDGGQPERLVVGGSRVGRRLPVHCTALGKVLLGSADESVRSEYDRTMVSAQRLEKRTGATILDREKLFEQVRTVAGEGFALDLEECEEGLACAAAPVFDSNGVVVAALSISGPTSRLSEGALLTRLAPCVVASAAALSGQLGYEH